jgi:DMSO/TMAO reductase YedYZ molybdopterin-dependent catalytic subunit
MTSVPLTRRDFVSAALLLPALARQNATERFVGIMPLGNPGGASPPPFGRLLGDGLDARLFTDLSQLRDSQSATRTEEFFVRTAAPKALDATDQWSVQIGGLVRSPAALNRRNLEELASPLGRVLIECSGNADQTSYGLMSTAEWDGVPLAALLDRAAPSAASYRIRISGVDDPGPSRTSVPGASWIFSRDELQRAMLAMRMNGAPLTRDHGFPARLIVPGWYGCACIKWVDRIDLVSDDATATSQMREFAARTHQNAEARIARDFVPAIIDTAAMPVRAEKWLIDGRLAYRLTGIIWGGAKPTNALSIRFKANEPWARVDDCPLPTSTLTWSFWSHTWRPSAPGRYQIVLRVDDPAIRTRRLDLFFYVREIQIDDI